MSRRHATDPAALERAQVLLALALEQVPPPIGERPGLDRIAAWVEGELPPGIADEVASWVARDRDAYHLWLDYLDARATLAIESTGASHLLSSWLAVLHDRLKTWWSSGSIGGGLASGLLAATAILLLVVSFAPFWLTDPLDGALDREYRSWVARGHPPPHQWGWRLAGVTRGKGAVPNPLSDPERSAFLTGLSNRASELGQWPPQAKAHLNELPRSPVPCVEDSHDCHHRQQGFRQLGEWILLLSVACADAERTDQWDSDFWFHQRALWQDFRHRFAALECHSQYCTAVHEALGTDDTAMPDPIAYCDLSETLLEHTYQPGLSD